MLEKKKDKTEMNSNQKKKKKRHDIIYGEMDDMESF